jgi:uncharacterized protein
MNTTNQKKIEILLIGGSIKAAEELNRITQNKNVNSVLVYAQNLTHDMQSLIDGNSNIKRIDNLPVVLDQNKHVVVVADFYANTEGWIENIKQQRVLVIKSFQQHEANTQIKISSEKKWKCIAYISSFGFISLLLFNILSFYFTWNDAQIVLNFLNENTDDRFISLLIVGFVAQMVDGALGMGYGVTSTAALLYLGIPLPSISSSIHTAEIFSSGASGFSHYKFGNINKKLFRSILIPGIIGAVLGALLLSLLGEEYAKIMKPILAVYTLLLGIKIFSNAFKKRTERKKIKRVGWLAGAGGFLDSFGGGGWGPVVTSTLISKGKTPKYVIGTVSLTEFFVTMASALTFFSVIGIGHWQLILGLVIGGVVAAPLAAKIAGKLPIKQMFIAVGLLIIVWSLNIFLKTLGVY